MPVKLRSLMKDLINIKNNDNKCFLWHHIRHFNPLKINPKRITKQIKKWLIILIMKGLNFLSLKKIIVRLKKIKNICISVFCYENYLVCPVYVSNEKFKNCMDLLFITDENKPHYVYIKNFNRLMCNKTKDNNKTHFCRYCLQCFTSERVLIKHKKI